MEKETNIAAPTEIVVISMFSVPAGQNHTSTPFSEHFSRDCFIINSPNMDLSTSNRDESKIDFIHVSSDKLQYNTNQSSDTTVNRRNDKMPKTYDKDITKLPNHEAFYTTNDLCLENDTTWGGSRKQATLIVAFISKKSMSGVHTIISNKT